MKNFGFTLIELIAVILILGIMAKIAVSRWPGNNLSLISATQQLGSEIRRTQALAMSHGQRFRINLTSSGYSITNSAGTSYYTDVVGGQNTISYSSGITASWSNAVLTNNLVSFDENGTPYIDSAATSALSSTAVITLTSGGYTHTVSITPGTGRILVQ